MCYALGRDWRERPLAFLPHTRSRDGLYDYHGNALSRLAAMGGLRSSGRTQLIRGRQDTPPCESENIEHASVAIMRSKVYRGIASLCKNLCPSGTTK